MSAATLVFGGDRLAPRQTLAFSLSLCLHLAFAILIFAIAEPEVPPPPLEISIFEGPRGPASPPPGEKSAEPGPVGPPPEVAKPIEAPKAPSAPRVKVARRPNPARQRVVPIERPVEEQALLAALQKTGPAPTTQAVDGVQSDGQLRQAPVDGAAGSGGGGTGRGGFSVSGAGAGGSGRSYASIWEWTQRYLDGLRWAYNNELRNNAGLRGVVVVRYEILASGSVGQVTLVSSRLKDAGLEQQVLSQIRSWRYPPEPSGTVVVTWPFSFRPPS